MKGLPILDRKTSFTPGSAVKVRSLAEIEATLDNGGTLDGMPFTAEMRKYCGRTFEVSAHANRIQVEGKGIRRIKGCVLLKDVRCTGEAHGGCQRGCLLMFKTNWLHPSVLPVDETKYDDQSPSSLDTPSEREGLSSCQGLSSCLLNATSLLQRWDIRQYLRDIGAGTLSIRQFLCMSLFLLNKQWDIHQKIWDITPETLTLSGYLRELALLISQNVRHAVHRNAVPGRGSGLADAVRRDDITGERLEPGDIVEVKSKDEILQTLDAKGRRHRGMSFEGSQVKYCGKRFRVLKRVAGLIVESKDAWQDIRDTVMLENCTCDGLSFRGCPRRCYWLWREVWLRKVDDMDQPEGRLFGKSE